MLDFKSRSSIFVYLYLGALAFLSLALFSITTSPFFGEVPAVDSAIFQIIGKGWTNGYLPYVDLWDLKGPLIFLYNCVGYLISGNSSGVFLLQFVSLCLTLNVLFIFLRKGFSIAVSCLLIFLTVINISANNLGGNSVAEYLLPLLAISFYLLYGWVERVTQTQTYVSHPPKYAIFYGMALSYSLFSRLTNATGICGAVAVVGIYLIYHKQWGNLAKNLLSFIMGFLLVALPVIIYFRWKGAEYEMWYGTVLYNIDYAGGGTPVYSSARLIAKSFVYYIDIYLLLITSIVLLTIKQRRFAGVMWFTVATITLLWLVNGRGYSHYGLIAIPYFCVSMIEIRHICSTFFKSKSRITCLVVATGYALVVSASLMFKYSFLFKTDFHYAKLDYYRQQLSYLPDGYKDSFIAYNCDAALYLYNDITPYYPYFCFQDFEKQDSPSLTQRIRETFDKGNVEWIMVDNLNECGIKDILEKRYRLYRFDSNTGNAIFKHKH